MDTKFHLYEESGVKEYWIVQASEKTILLYALQNGKYIGLRPFTEGNVLESLAFPELHVQVDGVLE